MNFKKKILLLWDIFALLEPDPDPVTRLNPDPDTDPQPCLQVLTSLSTASVVRMDSARTASKSLVLWSLDLVTRTRIWLT